MTEADLALTSQLKRNARLGMIALGVRTALENLVILVANVYLARWLDPSDFGVFGILQFALSFFRLLADTGLGPALVQKQERPDDTELSTIWWFQLMLGLALTAISLLAVPVLPVIWHSLPHQAAWFLPALALSLLFTMMQSVPFLILERDVRFGWVGTLEFFGSVGYYGTAMFLAHRHAGAAALVWATLGQAALVSIVANLFFPWKPKLLFEPRRMKSFLVFGAAFQGGSAVGFINGAVTPLLVGARLGAGALGLVQFAESTAFFPSTLVSIVRRVQFPLLSRLQGDKAAFREEFERAVVLSAFPTFFFFGLLGGAAPVLVSIIYSEKWLPAVPALYIYSIGFCFTFFSWLGDAAMAALNDMGALFRIKVITGVLNWTATFLAVAFWPSPISFAWAYLLHLLIAPMMIHAAIARLLPGLRIVARLRGLAFSSIAVLVLGRVLSPHLHGGVSLVVFIVADLLAFTLIAVAVDRDLREIARGMISKVFQKSTWATPG